MATSVMTKNTTGNPRNRLSSSSDRNRRALEGCIGEWDMLTYSPTDPKVLMDLSGQGNHFTFVSNPTLNAAGLVFNGVNYADMVLSAPLVDNYTIVIVVDAPSPNGYSAFGNENININGSGMSVVFNNGTRFRSEGSNEIVVPQSGTGQWHGALLSIEEKQARGRPLNGGRLSEVYGRRPVAYTAESVRRRWRIGGRAKTVNGDVDVLDMPAPSGGLAYIMMFNKLKDFTEGPCLHEYVNEKMMLRGINYAV